MRKQNFLENYEELISVEKGQAEYFRKKVKYFISIGTRDIIMDIFSGKHIKCTSFKDMDKKLTELKKIEKLHKKCPPVITKELEKEYWNKVYARWYKQNTPEMTKDDIEHDPAFAEWYSIHVKK